MIGSDNRSLREQDILSKIRDLKDKERVSKGFKDQIDDILAVCKDAGADDVLDIWWDFGRTGEVRDLFAGIRICDSDLARRIRKILGMNY